MYYIITQIIGAMAYAALAFSYFKKQKKEILFMQIIAYLLFSIHYFMLDGLTGAICNVVGLVALIAIYLFDKYNLKNKKLLVMSIIPIFGVVLFFTYKDIFSIFPVIASSVTILSFITKSERTIRGIGIVSAECWLVYAIILRSPVTIILEVVILIFVVIAFVKFEKQKFTKKNKE